MDLDNTPIPVKLQIIRNPYPDVIPDPEFNLLVATVARRLAKQIFEDHTELGDGQFGYLKKASLGLCLMDPTVPYFTPARDAVMALIAIGDEGPSYVVNGVGKAVEHWELGEICGIGAYVNSHRLPDGSFMYGHSANVEGTIIGASAATEQQDRALATRCGAEFNSLVGDAHKQWANAHPEHKWYCNYNLPRALFTEIAGWLNGLPHVA